MGLQWLQGVRECLGIEKNSERHYALIDVWVHIHLFLAVMVWAFFNKLASLYPLILLLVICGSVRILLIVPYAFYAAVFSHFQIDSEPKTYKVKSYQRILIFVCMNYLEVLFWFAVFYRFFDQGFDTTESNIHLNNITGSLYFSIITMTTLGYGDIMPSTNFGAFLCGFQTLLGVFWLVVVVAYFLTVMPHIQTLDDIEIRAKARTAVEEKNAENKEKARLRAEEKKKNKP